jgi:hypothetical protein
MDHQEIDRTDTWAWDSGIQSVVFTLYDKDHNRKGKAWPLRAHDHKLPTLEEIRTIAEELAADLGQPYDSDEVFVRSQYNSSEGGGLIAGKSTDEIAERWHRSMLSTCRAFWSLAAQLEAIRE